MAEDWSTLRELLVSPLDIPAAGDRRGRAIEQALRELIRTGRLHAGSRLPSSRDLAGQLGVARGTVTAAFNQLVAEGYLEVRRGSGTRVASTMKRLSEPAAPPVAALAEPASGGWRYDLGPGLPSLAEFPRAAWNAASRAGLADLTDAGLGYPDTGGLFGLRNEIASYLGRVRAVLAGPDQVVVTHGTFDSLSMLAAELHARGHRRIAVEDPSNRDVLHLLALHGLEPVPIPVDDEGLRVDVLDASGCRLVVVTAAHQYPLGVAMSPRRRRAVVEWARLCDGLVIEDDYDSEYRYDRPALATIQGLDPDRVIHLGTTSKTLAPGLRLGWMVAPLELATAITARKRLSDRGGSAFLQAAFQQLLRGGGYDRHLRRTRLIYRRRRDAFLAGVAANLPGWRSSGIAAGMHLVLYLPARGGSVLDTEVSAALAAHGIKVAALSDYTHATPRPAGLVCGYAALTPDRLRAATAEIARILG
jgi:GntR family transcriptional regulator / MocR family aminotransferase